MGRAVLAGAVLVGLSAWAPPPSVASQAVNYPPVPPGTDSGCLGLKKPVPRLSANQMAKIDQQLMREHERDIDSGGSCPGGPAFVQLKPGREWLARELQAQYGPKLAIFVGLTAWHREPGRSPVCGDLPAVPVLRQRVSLALRLQSYVVGSGSDFTGTVTLTNHEQSRFATNIGQPLEAVILRAGVRRVVGVYADGIGGTGLLVSLAPGGLERVTVIGGTARCDGGTGSALPAGQYGVTVLVRDESDDLAGESTFSAYVGAPQPLKVIAAVVASPDH
jgi:hypothetical protein